MVFNLWMPFVLDILTGCWAVNGEADDDDIDLVVAKEA